MRRKNEPEIEQEAPSLSETSEGLALVRNELTLVASFESMKKRLKQSNYQNELLVKAARLKTKVENPTLLDATAGLGEDSILLAAAGFTVTMYEYNETIAALLRDALRRAKDDPELSEIAGRMTLIQGDSVKAMQEEKGYYDVIYLDPMFPEREKSALIKKKFQLIHGLEKPCDNEEALLNAAMALRPRKLIVKRPLKGAYLAGRKPDYSLSGKAIRYDCFTFAKE